MERPPVVTVPDAEDLGVTFDPLAQHAKTDYGTVRPVVVVALLNREQARRAARWARKRAREHPDEPEPVLMRQPLSPADTTDRMASILIDEWERYHQHFPLKVLSDYLDERTSKTLEEAMKQGRPLDRDAVRRALGGLMQDESV